MTNRHDFPPGTDHDVDDEPCEISPAAECSLRAIDEDGEAKENGRKNGKRNDAAKRESKEGLD